MKKFNANTIILENSVFKNIEEHAVNYIRKIPTPDIPGGNLIITNCIFSNVYNQKDGKIIRTDGIHRVEITNSVFENSNKVDDPVYLKGKNNVISNCLIYKSGSAKVSKGAKQVNIIYKKPRWEDEMLFIPKEKSLLLRKNNNVGLIGIRQ